MSQRKSYSNDKKSSGEDNAWLETYADTITLLMAFFVILLSMSSMNKKKYDVMRESVNKGFTQNLSEQIRTESPKQEMGFFAKPKVPSMKKYNYLQTQKDVKVEYTDNGAKFVFQDDLLFVPNSASLRGDIDPLLSAMVRYLKQLKKNDHSIIVEGHTDSVSDVPRRYKNRWNFSVARAMAMRQRIESAGVDPAMISIAAFADQQPVKPNVDRQGFPIALNNIANRRLVIRIQGKTK